VTTHAFQGSLALDPDTTLTAASPDAWEAYFA
jgi:hypothetical protein